MELCPLCARTSNGLCRECLERLKRDSMDKPTEKKRPFAPPKKESER